MKLLIYTETRAMTKPDHSPEPSAALSAIASAKADISISGRRLQPDRRTL